MKSITLRFCKILGSLVSISEASQAALLSAGKRNIFSDGTGLHRQVKKLLGENKLNAHSSPRTSFNSLRQLEFHLAAAKSDFGCNT